LITSMAGLPRRARVYLLCVCAAAAAVFTAAATWLVAGDSALALPHAGRPELVAVLAQLVLLSVIAQHFPLTIGPRRKQDLTQMVHLAILLLAGTPLAVVLTGCAEAVGQALYLVRRDKQGRRLRGLNSVLFNTGQITLGVAVAGLLGTAAYALSGGAPRPGLALVGIDLPTLARVVTTAGALYVTNSAMVATMIALHAGKNTLTVWREGRAAHALQSAGMLILGALTAHTAAESAWVPLAMALPAALTYCSMKRSAEAEAGIKLRDEFLGVAAHELRTPLTSLRGYAQLLVSQVERTGTVDPAKLARSLRTIDRQSSKLCELIDQLLDVTRLQANNLALERGTVDLVGLARDVTASLQPLTPGIQYVVDAPGSVVVEADRLRLEQVLTNLITNAYKHGGAGGRIELAVRGAQRGHVSLSVRDFGPGIPAVHRERVFDRFFQSGPEAKAGGLGLGLYITRQIVELHGGRIEVSCPVGGGTLFAITLPAPTVAPVAAAAPLELRVVS
ncbi:MAG TPA: HAMP domain-containing sensor histidine kinase, partial [Chloroflexota bacterium]|nr:HAMP domain-containing sensor histidine kinase [Chloroflexota bacterium]